MTPAIEEALVYGPYRVEPEGPGGGRLFGPTCLDRGEEFQWLADATSRAYVLNNAYQAGLRSAVEQAQGGATKDAQPNLAWAASLIRKHADFIDKQHAVGNLDVGGSPAALRLLASRIEAGEEPAIVRPASSAAPQPGPSVEALMELYEALKWRTNEIEYELFKAEWQALLRCEREAREAGGGGDGR